MQPCSHTSLSDKAGQGVLSRRLCKRNARWIRPLLGSALHVSLGFFFSPAWGSVLFPQSSARVEGLAGGAACRASRTHGAHGMANRDRGGSCGEMHDWFFKRWFGWVYNMYCHAGDGRLHGEPVALNRQAFTTSPSS